MPTLNNYSFCRKTKEIFLLEAFKITLHWANIDIRKIKQRKVCGTGYIRISHGVQTPTDKNVSTAVVECSSFPAKHLVLNLKAVEILVFHK